MRVLETLPGSRAETRSTVLVNIAEQPYSDQHRRNQMIFECLLADGGLFDAGLYVNAPLFPSTSRLADVIQALIHPFESVRLGQPALVATPAFFLPLSWHRPVARVQAALFGARTRRILAGRRYWLWVNNPDFGAFAIAWNLQRSAERVVVDLSDDFTAFVDPHPEALERRVRALVGRADALLAVNEHVAAKFPHPRGMVFPNATDFGTFQRFDAAYRLGDVLPKPAGKKYVGFTGGLHRGRVDEELLREVIDFFPEVKFLFVGYTNDASLFRQLESKKNVRVFPQVPYVELPSVIRSFDVAIVPHLDNEFTRGNDLLKVRDYLACGVPVVSTRSSNIERFAGTVHIADGPVEFIRILRKLLSHEIRHDPKPGLNLAQRESWMNVVPPLARWLEQTLRG